jgi:starch phosphorylase
MAPINDGFVKMSNLAVATCHSVNGVSALHSQILKDSVFNNFFEVMPQKFENVTNGIAHRRWLCQANPELCSLVEDLIGDKFVKNAENLEKLMDFVKNKEVLQRFMQIKRNNKLKVAKFIKKQNGIILDPDSIFDVQVKRMHEYKRQHLNALHILSTYFWLKQNPNADFAPKTYIFGGKAAPGYYFAKQMIKLIFKIGEMVNNDPEIRGLMKVVFVEDYRVTLAEKLIPAADVSEQISLAGTEASGTGNMKFMLNGAITLGTLDGANVEIMEAIGPENMVIFGMKTEEVELLKKAGYRPIEHYERDERIKNSIDAISNGILGESFSEISDSLKNRDQYMVLADFADYSEKKQRVWDLYQDVEGWAKMALINVAKSGRFAGDRAIREYAEKIWKTESVK